VARLLKFPIVMKIMTVDHKESALGWERGIKS
jgi:hypothetical protein